MTRFERCRAVLDPDFSMVTPRGQALSCDDVLSGIRDGHGGRREAGSGSRRRSCLFETAAIVAARYQEWQQQGGDPDGAAIDGRVRSRRDNTKRAAMDGGPRDLAGGAGPVGQALTVISGRGER